MKFDCGPTRAEKHQAKKEWHLHFAWWPIRVGLGDCRWLEWVMRKGTFHYRRHENCWDWEYRAR